MGKIRERKGQGGINSIKNVCICMFCLRVHLCMKSTQCPQTPKDKQESSPLELNLQTVVSHHVGTGNRAQVCWKDSK